MATSKTWKVVSLLFCILTTFISTLHAEEVRLVTTTIDFPRPEINVRLMHLC